MFGQDFVNSLEEGQRNREDTAGNLLRIVLFVAAVAVVAMVSARRRGWAAVEYILAVSAGFVELALITASVELFGVHCQLPFFVLAAPTVGLAVSRFGRLGLSLTTAVLQEMAAVPYFLLNNTRPLVRTRSRTRVGSMLMTPAVDPLFEHVPEQKDAYMAAAEAIRTSK